MNFQRVIIPIVVASASLGAQDITLRGRASVIHAAKEKSGSGNVVVWLTPKTGQFAPAPPTSVRLIQRDKRFSPHVIAVRVGSDVDFPNQDLFFHDVFSIYHGKPFDLGLYESGTSRKVRFSKAGVSYIFCNIHPEMSAAVVAVPTPYFAVTSEDGSFQIEHLVRGRYRIAFWYELSSPAELDTLSRDLAVDVNPAQVKIEIHSSDIPALHLNKYGREYPIEKTKSY